MPSFTHNGRRYRVWQRRAVYYFRLTGPDGRRVTRSLDTSLAPEAIARAKAMLKQRESDKWGQWVTDSSRRRRPPLTIPELAELYLQAPVDASLATRRQNLACLRNILATVTDQDPDRLTVAALDRALATRWFALKRAQADAAEPTAAGRIRRSANSIMRQARSVFAGRALESYPSLDVGAFMAAARVHSITRAGCRDWTPPSDAVIAATLAGWLAVEDRNLFLAVGLALSFGLRRGEIAQARWDWLVLRNGRQAIEGAAQVKSGTGRLAVTGLDPYCGQLLGRAASAGWWEGEFMLAGNPTERRDGAARRASAWLRALGWETTHALHELRAWAGSQVALKWDIYVASRWLRHAAVQVTQNHYAGYVTSHTGQGAPEGLDWARPAVPLRALEAAKP